MADCNSNCTPGRLLKSGGPGFEFTPPVAALLILLFCIIAYANSLDGVLVLDDIPSIVRNQRIRQLWPIWLPLTGSARPVVYWTFALNYAISGLDPWSYHVANILIHAAAGMVLFGIVRRTLPLNIERPALQAAAVPLATIIALLWTVHPLQTQSITYVVQRCEALMGLFYLLTLYCFIRGCTADRSRYWLAGAVTCCALGMASKEVMVTAPLIVLLYDRAFLVGSLREALRQRWSVYVGLCATWLIPLGLYRFNLIPTTTPSAGFAATFMSPAQYLSSQPEVIIHYLKLAMWPAVLCLDYMWTPADSQPVGFAECLFAVGLIFSFLAVFRWPKIGFPAAWFFLILAPTSSIVPIADLAFEHRMYLPLAAVVTAVVLAGNHLRVAVQRRNLPPALVSRVVGATILGTTLALTIATAARNRDYHDSTVMWSDVLATRPHNDRALINLGTALVVADQLQLAESSCRLGLHRRPGFLAHMCMGLVYTRQRRFDEALQHYDRALAMQPGYAPLHTLKGLAQFEAGDPQAALRSYQFAAQGDRGAAVAHSAAAFTLIEQGRHRQAAEHLHQALQRDPQSASAHSNLGLILASQGLYHDALRHYLQAARLQPDLFEPYFNSANILVHLGRPDLAVELYRQALKLQPDSLEIRQNLAATLARLD